MNRRLAFVLLISGLAACTQSPIPVHFQQICFPPEPNSTTGVCEYSPECETVLASGRLDMDITATHTLWASLQLNNQLEPNDDLSAGRVDGNTAYVTEFRMEYALNGGGAGSFVSRQNLTVESGGSQAILLELVPEDIGAALTEGELIITVKAFGKLRSGGEFESDAYTVPVEIVRDYYGTQPTGVVCCPQWGQTAVCITKE